jgi:hypothetical protein
MTLQELLPAIDQLSDAEKYSLWELLDRNLHSKVDTSSVLRSEDFDHEGQWWVAIFDQCFGEVEPIEISD